MASGISARMTDRYFGLSLAELSRLWHVSRTATAAPGSGALSAGTRRYHRLLWASRAYAEAHPETSSTAAYKALERMLADGGR